MLLNRPDLRGFNTLLLFEDSAVNLPLKVL